VGREFARVGGNTSCIAFAHDGETPSLVLDAGTGLRRVTSLLGGAPFRGTIVLGHLHWDHTQGLPFFAAGDRPDARVRLLLPDQGIDAAALLGRAMSPPHFPIGPHELRGEWTFASIDEGGHRLEGFEVLVREIPHKGGRTFGMRVSAGGHSVAYLSDHAPQEHGAGSGGVGALHPAARALVDGADVLLHDAQYTAAELPARGAFGHAAYEYAIELAEACRVKRLLLFHHDPARTDDEVDVMVARARLLVRCGTLVDAATEGSEIVL
jgi:phosphoribosyl 1,2-cyclic phosphodiesterase